MENFDRIVKTVRVVCNFIIDLENNLVSVNYLSSDISNETKHFSNISSVHLRNNKTFRAAENLWNDKCYFFIFFYQQILKLK